MDQTLSLLKDPYRFISRRCQEEGKDFFLTRLLFKKTVCLRGQEAAKIFYDPSHFIRKGAAPEPLRATLFGKGGVQGLDDDEHVKRKKMFMSLMSKASIRRLTARVSEELNAALGKWSKQDRIVLYDEFHQILTKAVCDWAGLSVDDGEVKQRAQQLAAMFDLAGSVNFGHIVSRYRRKQAEHWVKTAVRCLREAKGTENDSPAAIIAHYRKPNGKLLDEHEAAVEILNLLRPTVAVSVYMVFVVHALHLYPEYRQQLLDGNRNLIEPFVQEVRRHYPFFPAVVARVRENFLWHDFEFEKDTPVILDLYGTNHDRQTWEDPYEFKPERFFNWNESAFNFVPQGGGDHHRNHRCPGEWVTIEIMKQTLEFFVFRMTYQIPRQNLKLRWTRMPPVPNSRFIITKVVPRSVSEAIRYSPSPVLHEQT